MSTPNAPVVTAPHLGADFTTNRDTVTFAGTVDVSGVSEVLLNGSSTGVTYVVGSGVWTADVTISEGSNSFSFTAVSTDATPLTSAATTVVVTYSEDLALVITNPTGIAEDILREAIKVSWVENPESQVVGYNVYGSLTAGGGDDGYTRLNSVLLSTVQEVRTSLTEVSKTISEESGVRTTTTVENVSTTNIYSYTIDEWDGEALSLGQTYHLVVTAVGYDATASEEIESPFSEEIGITPLVLSEALVEAPSRTQQQIATDYASLVRDAVPSLDIKPGSSTQDVHINPPSTEMEKLYFRLDFLSKAQSFVELLAIDDPNGDEVSDSVQEVSYKRALKAALNSDSDTVTQDYIDAAFTRLASVSGTERKSSTAATGPYVFYRATAPAGDVSIPAGSVVASQGNADQGISAQQYVTTVSVAVSLENISSYYNPTTERYEFTSFIEAQSPGADGNQDVGDITIVVSGPNVTLQGENTTVLSNGQDEESNADLALRSQLAFLGVDSGTPNGYRKAAINVASVERAKVVDAGDVEMQRDFNVFLREHDLGRVDIYIKGSTPLDKTEDVAFSYYSDESNALTIVDASNFVFEVDTATEQLSVSSTKPLFEVTAVRNVTQSVSYDVHNIQFDGKQFTMDTSLSGNSGLVASNVVQADFRWRDGDSLVLQNQPVTSVTTVAGDSSGSLTSGSNYNFDKSEDPMLKGNSTQASDAVILNFGPGAEVADESQTLNSTTETLLDNPDIDTSTIVVTDSTGDITYVLNTDYDVNTYQKVFFEDEPHSLSTVSTSYLTYNTVLRASITVTDAAAAPTALTENVDYTLVENGLQIGIKRVAGGAISEGGSVYVTYRVGTPVLFTYINRTSGTTTIGDGDTVLVTYNKGVPRGRPVLIEDEEIVLVGTEFIPLSRKGVLPNTIEVDNPSASPTTMTEGVDYLVEVGDDTTSTKIRRLASGSISDGQTVEVTYRANERFTLTYAVNDLVRVVQSAIDDIRHGGADVLVKEALDSGVDLEMTVVPNSGVNSLSLINNIKTAISRHFTSLSLGAGIYQANIVDEIEEVTGVDHTVLPFLKMTRTAGTLILREEHRNPGWSLWASDVSDVYRSQVGTLKFATTAGGGSQYLPRGVYEDEVPMSLVNTSTEVKGAFGRAYIASDGSILVSPVDGDPDNHTYTVTYQMGTEMGTKDIRLTSLESAAIGTVSVALSDPED